MDSQFPTASLSMQDKNLSMPYSSQITGTFFSVYCLIPIHANFPA